MDFGPGEVPEIKCPIETSLMSDIFALRKISEYRGGAILQWAWISTGYTSEEEMCLWRYDGDMEELNRSMQRVRGGYKDLLHMKEIPSIDPAVGIGFALPKETNIYIYMYIHMLMLSQRSCKSISIFGISSSPTLISWLFVPARCIANRGNSHLGVFSRGRPFTPGLRWMTQILQFSCLDGPTCTWRSLCPTGCLHGRSGMT